MRAYAVRLLRLRRIEFSVRTGDDGDLHVSGRMLCAWIELIPILVAQSAVRRPTPCERLITGRAVLHLRARPLIVRRRIRKLPLRLIPDEAILRLAQALARQAAREDHERDQLSIGTISQESGDLRPVLD